MKNILLIGAGKSATCLIDYLIGVAGRNNWTLTVADADEQLARSKIGGAAHCQAIGLDISNEGDRNTLISRSDLVISLLPPHLHILAAQSCISAGKNLLTASYVDPLIKNLEKDIQEKHLLFLYEMGLDPGIDHMSAVKLIDAINARGGTIKAFRSHCGGLVAPESDDNPWHYKVSWNPRNIVQAGKSGAVYLENGKIITEAYQNLFNPDRIITVPGLGKLSWYPNRDSLGYRELYHLDHAKTFIRTTLRHPDFCRGWSELIRMNFTDEQPRYDTDGMSLKAFFEQHLGAYDAHSLDEIHSGKGKAFSGESQFLKQLIHLGLQDDGTLINKGKCSALDVLQFCLEKKLALGPHDRDMIVMMHELEYELDNRVHKMESTLTVKGKDPLRTAMAQTVGLPLGIAARLILENRIGLEGLRIPTDPQLYEPVLNELSTLGISFHETDSFTAIQ